MTPKTPQHSELPLPGFIGYSINNVGDVFSINWPSRGKRKIRLNPDNHGYLLVRVSINGQRKHLKVHQLVCSLFVGPRPSLVHEVRHLDGNRKNNIHTNLAWGTRKENSDDKIKHGNLSHGLKHSRAIKKGLPKLNWQTKRKIERDAALELAGKV